MEQKKLNSSGAFFSIFFGVIFNLQIIQKIVQKGREIFQVLRNYLSIRTNITLELLSFATAIGLRVSKAVHKDSV